MSFMPTPPHQQAPALGALPASERTSKLAVLALILAVAGASGTLIACVLSWDVSILAGWLVLLLALVLALVSHFRTRRSRDFRGQQRVRASAHVCWVAFVFSLLFLPALTYVQDRAALSQSTNNLKTIANALHSYADEHHGHLPPRVVRDEKGRPLYSWRVLVLPYMGVQGYYLRFHKEEQWDSPHNLTVLTPTPYFYRCRTPRASEPPEGTTYYQVFTGPGTAFEDPGEIRFPKDFTDGSSNTILITEAGEPVPWSKPVDLVYSPHEPIPALGGVFCGEGSRLSLFRPLRGANVALGDGSVRFIDASMSETTLRAAIVRNDGTILGPDW